jgi:predicted GH43/DUF377 family glycosyl hydrolase
MLSRKPNHFLKLFLFLFVNSSIFAQVTWEKFSENPVLHSWSGNKNDPSDYSYAIEPSILYDSVKNIYHCWFLSKTNQHGSRSSISYAVSFDGIKWFSYFKNPVLEPTQGSFDELSIYSCSVLKDGEGYKMYYTGRRYDSDKYNPDKYSIGLASSGDGYNWQKYQKNPVISCSSEPTSWKRKVYYPQVKYDGGKYWMWYGANDGTYDNTAFAISENGRNWSESSNNPVLRTGNSNAWDATKVGVAGVCKVGPIWYLFYTGINISISSNQNIGLATSIDGIHWNKYHGNPILSISTPGKWDDNNLGGGTVLFHNNKFHLWYSGQKYYTGAWQIGYATSNFELFAERKVSPQNIGFVHDYPTPFISLTNIEFEVREKCRVKIYIFNTQRQIMRRLIDEEKEPEDYTSYWDGRNESGNVVSNGVYFYRIAFYINGKFSASAFHKMILLQ